MCKDKKTTEVAPSVNYAMSAAGQEEAAFAVLQRKATMFAKSSLVPTQYRGAENIGNCAIALEMAQRMQCLPLMIMQNLYIVHGTPAFSSKFLVACINSSKRFSPLRYEFKGTEGKPDYGCRVYAYEASDKEHKEPLYGDWITLDMAEKEGWAGKAGSKWKSMPSQMLRYRAAAFWQRVYCPEISMGLMTVEEAEDIEYAEYEEVSDNKVEVTQAEPDTDINQMLEAMQKGTKKPAKQEPQEVKVDVETGELFPNT